MILFYEVLEAFKLQSVEFEFDLNLIWFPFPYNKWPEGPSHAEPLLFKTHSLTLY